MSADDIRKSLALLESVQKATLVERPVPFLKQVATFGKGLFSDMAAGEFQTNRAANRTYLLYLQYLGKIGKKIDQSTIGDLFEFLVASGVDKNTVMKAMSAGITQQSDVVLKDMASLQQVWNSEIKDNAKQRLEKTFLLAVQMAQRLPKDQIEPTDIDANIKSGLDTAKKAEGGAKPVAGKPAAGGTAEKPEATPTPPPPAEEPATPPATGLEKDIEAVMGKKDKKAQLDSIEKALKSLGAAK